MWAAEGNPVPLIGLQTQRGSGQSVNVRDGGGVTAASLGLTRAVFPKFKNAGTSTVVAAREGSEPKRLTISAKEPREAIEIDDTAKASRPERDLTFAFGPHDSDKRHRKTSLLVQLHPTGVRITPSSPGVPARPTLFLHPMGAAAGPQESERFGSALRQQKEKQIVEGLKLFDARIRDLVWLPRNGGYFAVAINGGERVPFGVFGGGANRLLQLLLGVVECENSLLLIDEFESGFHHSIMQAAFEALISLAEQCKTQLVLSTHSEEALQKLACAIENRQASEKLCLIQLLKDGQGVVRSWVSTGERAMSTIKLGLEVR